MTAYRIPRIDRLTSELCAEIDDLRAENDILRAEAEEWRLKHARLTNSVIQNNEVMAVNMLKLCLTKSIVNIE